MHPFELASAYSHVDACGTNEMTTKFDCETVDFLFYSPRHLRITHTLQLLSPQRVRQLGGMPGPHFASDHQCLAARFAWVDE